MIKSNLSYKKLLKLNKLFKNKIILMSKIDKTQSISFNKLLKSFYQTSFASLIIISFFAITPKIIEIKKRLNLNNYEAENKSKLILEKVLNGENFEDLIENDNESYSAFIYDDVLVEQAPSNDDERLDAIILQELFKTINYDLNDVRKNKVVKPVDLRFLPKEIKNIENTKDRKNLFIKIVLPLIIEENEKILKDRAILFSILNKNSNSDNELKWLNAKFKQYGVKNKDILSLKIRMDIIPTSLTIAQAAKETGWGTSRFAIEGNALFGQWTYSGTGIKPLKSSDNENHKVMKFQILKASVRAYHRNLNTHSSYREFRMKRAEARDNDESLDSILLADYLDKYAETGLEYTKILKKIIVQNSLKEFDDVKLLKKKNIIKKQI
jgi:Bax protein